LVAYNGPQQWDRKTSLAIVFRNVDTNQIDRYLPRSRFGGVAENRAFDCAPLADTSLANDIKNRTTRMHDDR